MRQKLHFSPLCDLLQLDLHLDNKSYFHSSSFCSTILHKKKKKINLDINYQYACHIVHLKFSNYLKAYISVDTPSLGMRI